MVASPDNLRDVSETGNFWSLFRLSTILALMASVVVAAGLAQQAPSPQSQGATIQGTVVDVAHHRIADASVMLEQNGRPGVVQTKTDSNGGFIFLALGSGTYRVSSEKSGLHSRPFDALVLSAGEQRHVDLVLEASTIGHGDSRAASSAGPMEFADQPNFTVAGVTDWTAAGGHGSDAGLRTSEDLTREAIVLKPAASRPNASAPGSGAPSESESRLRAALAKEPGSFDANHQLGEFYLRERRYSEAVPLLKVADRIDSANQDNEYDLALACQGIGDFSQAREHAQKLLAQGNNAELHRLLGNLDEELGDSLAAVAEDEKAVRLDPTEENYFQWGSELLLHRAVHPAAEVFENGAKAHPKSARMLAALGAALFASGQYDEAAQRVCDASDLNPADPAPYIFLGKIEMAAPLPLACVEPKLARFVQQQPENGFANYYYAMAIWKNEKSTENPELLKKVEGLLIQAVTIDPSFDEAYLQLGILASDSGDFGKAAGFCAKAIAINPQSSAAHYRLGVAYARMGETAKSKQEFQLYTGLDKQEAAAIERQRREIKQFLIVLKTPQSSPSTN
jgi:tetratricopeptide (TPR) repeat protein